MQLTRELGFRCSMIVYFKSVENTFLAYFCHHSDLCLHRYRVDSSRTVVAVIHRGNDETIFVVLLAQIINQLMSQIGRINMRPSASMASNQYSGSVSLSSGKLFNSIEINKNASDIDSLLRGARS